MGDTATDAGINSPDSIIDGKRSPPKDLEMDVEINQGSYEEKSEPAKPTPKLSTHIVLTRAKRYTKQRSKTPKPIKNIPKGKCTPTSCKNGGRCQTMKSISSENYIISCQCRLGYDGFTCDRVTSGVRFPKFSPNGYLAFPERILNEEDFRLSVYVKPPNHMAGTLIAFKNSQFSNSFVLGIESNTFVFRFENSKLRKEIRHQVVIVNTNDRWYKVEIERNQSEGKLFVDDVESALAPIQQTKESSERYALNKEESEESLGNFICDFCLYLGGHPQLLNSVKKNHNLFSSIESTFTGCMRNLKIEDENIDMRRLPFYGRAVEGLAIEDCSLGLCDSVTCENGGKCSVSSDFLPICQCSFGFIGKNCKNGTIIKLPFFTGNSYASYVGLRGTSRSDNNIFIRFKPSSESGIILYQGYSIDKRGDFISIYLLNGYPWVSYDLGSGTISLKSRRSLELDQWHTIRFQRIGRKGTLIVNEEDSITGHSPGSQVQLTIKQNLLLGGVDDVDNVSAFLSIKNGFKGCIQMLFVDFHQVNLVQEIEASRNLENCQNHTCGNVRKVCWKDGECVPDMDNFVCSCPLGFIEANCQTKIQISSIRDPSFNGSSYLVYNDDRILMRLSESKFNLSMFFNLRVVQSDRLLLHATRTRQFNNEVFFSLKINSKSGVDLIISSGVERIDMTLVDKLPILSDHRLQMIKDKDTIQFIFNNTYVKPVKLRYTSLSTLGFSKLFIGGTDFGTAILMNLPVQSGIMGCIRKLTLDWQPIRVTDANDGRSVAECGILKS